MATLSITVDDAIVPRVRAAYGVDTNGQLKNAIITDIKNTVKSYELQEVATTEEAKVVAATEAKQAAIESKLSTVESELIIS